MSTPVFILREQVGLGLPTNTSGTPRPLLHPLLPYHTYHYTGVPQTHVFYSGGDGVFDRIEDVFAYLRRVEEVARATGKPYEYNTIIPVMADPEASYVIAYADEYQAAHSAGENPIAHGTQFSTGIDQDLSPGAIRAFRWWHAVLLASGRLAPDCQTLPHHDMPGAATACPGPKIDARRPELLTPWSPDPEPTPEENPMHRYKDRRYTNEWLVSAAGALPLSGKLSAKYQAVELIEDEHDQMLASLCLTTWPVGDTWGDAPPATVIAVYTRLGFLVR